MQFYFHASRDSGCEVHRGLYPTRYLTCDFPQHQLDFGMTFPERDYDVNALHGLLRIQAMDWIGRWKRERKRFCWSLDDDFLTCPKWNPSAPTEEQLPTWYCTRDCADLILVSTPHLADTIAATAPEAAAKTVVARNLLDLSQYPTPEPAEDTEKLVVMWAGSQTHLEDLTPVVPAVSHCLQKYPDRVEFVFMGYCHPTLLRDHLHNGLIFQDGVPFSLYNKVVTAIRPHIVMAPLAPIPFNLSKSNIRILEGWALSAATVASPIGEYQCVQNGVDGLVAEDTDQWVDCLERLLLDRELRRGLAVAGRQRCEREWNWQSAECRQRQGWTAAVERLAELAA